MGVLLPALAFFARPIFLVLGPILVALPGAAYHRDQNRYCDNRYDDEPNAGRYGDTHGKDLPLHIHTKAAGLHRPTAFMLSEGAVCKRPRPPDS